MKDEEPSRKEKIILTKIVSVPSVNNIYKNQSTPPQCILINKKNSHHFLYKKIELHQRDHVNFLELSINIVIVRCNIYAFSKFYIKTRTINTTYFSFIEYYQCQWCTNIQNRFYKIEG